MRRRSYRADIQATWTFAAHCPRCQRTRAWLVTEYDNRPQATARCAGCTRLMPVEAEHRALRTHRLPQSCYRAENYP